MFPSWEHREDIAEITERVSSLWRPLAATGPLALSGSRTGKAALHTFKVHVFLHDV